MNYIYDILINFNEKLYDFFEWNLNDNIEHIKKIPIFKIDNYAFNDILNNEIVFEDEFKIQIFNKTEIFTNKNVKKIEYACLFSDGMDVIALRMDKNKNLRSKLLIDEDVEVLEFCSNLDKYNIEYTVKNKIKNEPFKTRKQIEKRNFIIDNIKKLNHENDINKLIYLYYECFNEKELNKNKILKKLNQETENEKLYKFFKLLQISK